MCGSMADIQCAAAEIRRGKKRQKEQTTAWKYIWSALLHRATINYKHWDSAYLCQDTSYQVTSVAIQIQICDLDCHQNLNCLFISPLPTFPENFMQIRSEIFATDRQKWWLHILLGRGNYTSDGRGAGRVTPSDFGTLPFLCVEWARQIWYIDCGKGRIAQPLTVTRFLLACTTFHNVMIFPLDS